MSVAALPMRAARRRTCAPDSSPDMYSTRRPASATRAATCSNRVDLPTPGSPAMSIIEPGTMPPPSRRSTSAMPVVVRSAASSGCALSGAGPSGEPPTGRLRVRDGVLDLGSWNAAYVPHAPQPGQRPSHLGLVLPQSEQRNAVLGLALGGTRESSPTRANNATGGWRRGPTPASPSSILPLWWWRSDEAGMTRKEVAGERLRSATRPKATRRARLDRRLSDVRRRAE